MSILLTNTEHLEDSAEDVLAKAQTIAPEDARSVLDLDALDALSAGRSHPGPLEIPRGLRAITSDYFAMRVNCFLVWRVGSHDAVLFDTGADVALVNRALSEEKLKLAEILITHAHGDHIAVCEELCAQHGCPAHGMAFSTGGGALLTPGAEIATAIGPVRCGHVPGHAEDSLVYQFSLEGRPVAVVGDVIFSCSIGGLRSRPAESLKNIRDFFAGLPSDALLLPGHGPVTTVMHERRWNPFLAVAV